MVSDDKGQAHLLLAILGRRFDEAERLARAQPPDADSFLALCRECDVSPWIHALLSAEGALALLGDEIAARLAAARSRVRRDNLLLLARAEQALDLLLAAGIVPVALKGLDLLHRVYSQFDERSLDDVDLLLLPSDLRKALAALEKAGWRAPSEPERTHFIRSSHHLPLHSPGPLPVDFEIHWNLAQDLRFRIDAAELVRRAVPLDVNGRRVLRLEDHDFVAHLLLHHFTHYFDRRLKWAIDLQHIVTRADFRWSEVAERIRQWGASAVSAASLLHLKKVFPDLIPREILEKLPLAAWRRALLAPLSSDHPLEIYRKASDRRVRLYLAAVLLERPDQLPAWMLHRVRRDRRPSFHPLDRQAPSKATVLANSRHEADSASRQ